MAKEIIWYSVLMQGNEEDPMALECCGISYIVSEDGEEFQKTLEHEPDNWENRLVRTVVEDLIQAAKDAEGITEE